MIAVHPAGGCARTSHASPRDSTNWTNDSTHLFRAGDQLVGFQFWRALDVPEARLVLHGKRRVLPAYRRRALHLRSGLAYYREQLREREQVYR